MVYVPGGTFLMGAPQEIDRSYYPNSNYTKENPVHQVTLSDYWIGKYEVTQGLWKAVMDGNNPSTFQNGDNYPVEYVSWDDICDPSAGFLKKLKDVTGITFILPTEAQWEFAAAGGAAGYKTSDASRIHVFSGSDEIDPVAWFDNNSAVSDLNGDGRINKQDCSTHPVGQKQSNELGIYDMTGNVYEWCSDHYDPSYYQECFNKGVVKDPPGSLSGNYIERGGCFKHKADNNRVTFRNANISAHRNETLGFRLASNSNPSSAASASAATKPKIEVTVEVQVIKD